MKVSNGTIIEVTMFGIPRYTYDTQTVREWIEKFTSNPVLDNGIPLSREASSWCVTAHLEDKFEYEGIIIKIVIDD